MKAAISNSTLRISLANEHELEIWSDGHYQLWKDGELLVEGDDISETLFAYGSTVAPETSAATH